MTFTVSQELYLCILLKVLQNSSKLQSLLKTNGIESKLDKTEPGSWCLGCTLFNVSKGRYTVVQVSVNPDCPWKTI